MNKKLLILGITALVLTFSTSGAFAKDIKKQNPNKVPTVNKMVYKNNHQVSKPNKNQNIKKANINSKHNHHFSNKIAKKNNEMYKNKRQFHKKFHGSKYGKKHITAQNKNGFRKTNYHYSTQRKTM